MDEYIPKIVAHQVYRSAVAVAVAIDLCMRKFCSFALIQCAIIKFNIRIDSRNACLTSINGTNTQGTWKIYRITTWLIQMKAISSSSYFFSANHFFAPHPTRLILCMTVRACVCLYTNIHVWVNATSLFLFSCSLESLNIFATAYTNSGEWKQRHHGKSGRRFGMKGSNEKTLAIKSFFITSLSSMIDTKENIEKKILEALPHPLSLSVCVCPSSIDAFLS